MMSDICILIVDDNPSIHNDYKKILCPSTLENQEIDVMQAKILGKTIENKEYTFVVTSAYQGEEALHLIRKGLSMNCHYAVAFVDIRMPPGIDGIETAHCIWELDPEIQIVICTAYSDYSWEELTSRLGATDRLLILKKPFENIEVQQLANSLAKKWKLSQQLQDHLHHLEQLVSERTINLTHSLSLVKATLDAATDGILVLNKNQVIVDYNKNLLQMLHLTPEIIKNTESQSLKKIISEQLKNAANLLLDMKHHHRFGAKYSNLLHFKDGRLMEYFISPQYIENKIVGSVIFFRDITECQRIQDELILQATHDSLTGIPNRVLLFDRIQQALVSAKRSGQMVAVLFIDLDYFKRINDTFGHNIGDYVLKITATRLQESIRETDTLARIGGDEFIVVLPSLEKIDAIFSICQKIMNKISEPLLIKNETISFTTSIGISLFPKDGQDIETLIKNADTANQSAKETRNNFKFFTMELNINLEKRLILENNLRLALENNEFSLHYQPIINLATGIMTGVEALLRWQHPKLGLIPPQEYIPVAEEAGLMLPIGDWVLATACSQNKEWQNQGLSPIFMSVNLTSKQLAQTNIIEKIANILKKTGLYPTRFKSLVLEIENYH